LKQEEITGCYYRVFMFIGKRELLARGLFWSGASFLTRQLPVQDSLLVLNYHRIGNSDNDLFDPGIFSATGEQFDDQISYLKRQASLVTLDEALEFVEGTEKNTARRLRVLITFDDGYLDNYDLAFPVLRSHGVQGVFFLVSGNVGSCHVPWWDLIAHLIRTAQRPRFSLRYPAELTVDTERDGFAKTLRDVLRLYKRPENIDSARFIEELREAGKGSDPANGLRRFLDWTEAREMLAQGMAIGSHTHTHPVLSQLALNEQRDELAQSRDLLMKRLGVDVTVIAYPVGATTSFTEETRRLARETGYRADFSFYGGTNSAGVRRGLDVRRVGVGDQSWTRFQVQVALCKPTGRFWP
jgi:peptidoglycan/xylan/chitin deacetylase (PgdA/CDA1 family)